MTDWRPPTPTGDRWCILRTSGGKTLPLARSLTAAGIEAWSPKKTFRRPKPGKQLLNNGRRPTVEIDAPILPTFVFARAAHVIELLAIAKDPASRHPDFSVAHHGQRVPLVAEKDVAGLRGAEQEALELIERLRAADSAEEKRRLRAAALRTEQARRKALRSQHRDFQRWQRVQITDAPALIGMSGVIENSDGRTALVAFGGALLMQIETWQIVPADIQGLLP